LRWESDLFLIFSVAIGLTIAAIGTRAFGIPMALAGFVAGITINQTRDTDEVRKAILPFRDLFAVLFFVVIGSLLEPSQIINNLPFFGLLMLLLVLLKTIPAIAVAKYGKLKANRLQFGIGISQVGEFSFVLGSAALVAGAITKSQFAALLLTVTVSIILSTVLVRQIKRH
jgi:CPA2 family monovalent cation:H+ antiporter-2